jgi:hypothetical protein
MSSSGAAMLTRLFLDQTRPRMQSRHVPRPFGCGLFLSADLDCDFDFLRRKSDENSTARADSAF